VNISRNNSEATILAIPEPATLLLLGFGAVMLKRKRYSILRFDIPPDAQLAPLENLVIWNFLPGCSFLTGLVPEG